MREEFLPFFKPSLDDKEVNEIADTLKSGWLTAGPKTRLLEIEFAKKVGAKYAVGVMNCTCALELSLRAAKVQENDEVITTPLTFCATANVVEHIGARPVFADVDKETGLIDTEEIRKKVTKKTAAIIPVHIYGQPCDMDAIADIAQKYDLWTIEDAAHTIGSMYKKKIIGSLSDFTCFSFYANKNITTGEGGMITTQSKKKADVLKVLRLHGLSRGACDRYKTKEFSHYQVTAAGYNYTMFDVQAAMGLAQLRKLKKFDVEREKIWKRYDKAFESNDKITLLKRAKTTTKHGRHLYTILVENRDKIIDELRKQNIGTGLHYEALHLQPYYKQKYGFKRGDFPNAEFISDRTISLPLYPGMSKADVDDVIEAVEDAVKGGFDNDDNKKKL